VKKAKLSVLTVFVPIFACRCLAWVA